MFSRSLPALRRAPVFLRTQPFPVARLHIRAPVTQPLLRTPFKAPSLVPLHVRCVASSVSGNPGSQTPGHAAQNIKEEVGGAATDLAKSIAGGNLTVDAVKPVRDTFLGITSAVASSVPKPVFLTGLAGGVPYIAASATTVYLARQAGLAAAGVQIGMDPGVAITILDQALNLQVTYGAVMLSFLGALHWGMEFSGYGGNKGYPRLVLGIAPVLYAWSTLALDPTSALIAQWVGFTGLWWADLKATNAGWAPAWYSQYRFYLSILVGTCIIGSLAGTSYFGPVAGHGIATHDLDLIRAERAKHQVEKSGLVGGDVQALPADDQADGYVIIKKKESAKEEEEGGDEGSEGGDEAPEDGKSDDGEADDKSE